jgi:ankyrin repeat protein
VLCAHEVVDMCPYALQHGQTPSHDAALCGHVPILSMLCDTSPSSLVAKTIVRPSVLLMPLNMKKQDGYTPLHSAVVSSHMPAIQWITDRVPSLVLEQTNRGVLIVAVG